MLSSHCSSTDLSLAQWNADKTTVLQPHSSEVGFINHMLILKLSKAQVDQGSQIKMIQVKEMMQDNDLKNLKSKDKGSKSRSQSMDEQSHYKQDKTITRQSINVKRHIFNVIGDTEKFEERDLNIGGDYDYSRYGYVYLLKHKHEVFETFRVFKNEVENQLGKTIKAIRSDHGGEYISQEFKDYLKANGIVQQLTPPYTPQHNGVSERRNCPLLDMVRSMMNPTTLPLSFWDYALESATRILNMVPTKKVDKIPYELWYGKVPNLSYLKVWGCKALVKRDTPDKLEQRSVKCIFIGYPKETMGYYFYFPPENKIVVARYAEFFEKRLISQEISGRAVDLEEIQEEEDTTPSEITSNIPQEVEGFEPPQPPQEEVIPIRRSERTRRATNRLCLNIEVEEHSLGDLGEPANYKADMLDPESKRWVDAMNAEMQSMIDNMV
ncbi:retrotransposon protein, putative, ty1-copia subclass [Tanacetum coccineum]|uniref:Retrotransposon protein, putative, ty1-copia subclass n=1 Tax=Tanacetum coccineum TaxID=301880 RepID=A0ABQ5G558_9ASTR